MKPSEVTLAVLGLPAGHVARNSDRYDRQGGSGFCPAAAQFVARPGGRRADLATELDEPPAGPPQALWFHLQLPMASLGLAARVAADASAHRLRGAQLLNLLHERAAMAAGALGARAREVERRVAGLGWACSGGWQRCCGLRAV